MSTLPEENHDFTMDRHRERLTRQEQLKRTMEEATVMSELQADPRWERYGRRLEFERNRAKSMKERLEKVLLDPANLMSPADYMQAKVHQARATAYLDALQYALNVAKTTIEKGETAAAELKLLEDINET